MQVILTLFSPSMAFFAGRTKFLKKIAEKVAALLVSRVTLVKCWVVLGSTTSQIPEQRITDV